MSQAQGRLLRLRSEAYVFASVNPEDAQASASNIMSRLANFRSYTYLHEFEELPMEQAPKEVQEHFARGDLGVRAVVPEDASGEASEEQPPVELNFSPGLEPKQGDFVCRLRSATYVLVQAPSNDPDATWQELKQALSGPAAISVAEPVVDVMLPKDAPADVLLWVLYGAADRVVVPLWPEQYIDRPELATAWKEGPARAEPRRPYRGAYVRVVAVHPEHVRGMTCRIWHFRRDDTPGIGTVYGKYPVDVAVSVPTEERTPHVHSFSEISLRDWRPGLLFYNRTAEDGCPLSYLGERLEQYWAPKRWVPAHVWRSWLGDS